MAKRDLALLRAQAAARSQAEERVGRQQRTQMLQAQMEQIMRELGLERDEKQALVGRFREAVSRKTLPPEASRVLEAELGKLASLEPSSSEFSVCRTYLEWLTSLPWGQYTEENRDIRAAERILHEDHHGLEDVKERILEHLAVGLLKGSVQGRIMCLCGPPGVGKTSVGRSIARALGRKFFRFAVGGMHDVAELRGHRRTYVGALPGKLIQCLRITRSSNPVVLIDEIDKLGRDQRGDPASALLEVLDPEQNSGFRDHYLDVPVDLSRALFVCTANVTEGIPAPLLDRLELIRIAGYVLEEKLQIARHHLVPQTVEQSGVGADDVEISDEALRRMVLEYAREAGVRQLRQLLEKACMPLPRVWGIGNGMPETERAAVAAPDEPQGPRRAAVAAEGHGLHRGRGGVDAPGLPRAQSGAGAGGLDAAAPLAVLFACLPMAAAAWGARRKRPTSSPAAGCPPRRAAPRPAGTAWPSGGR